MKIVIQNVELEKIYQESERGKSKYSSEVKKKFIKTIKMLMIADDLADIRKLKGLNFEALKGDLKGKHSVRVDIKYRIILRVEKDKILIEDILVIEDLTNHYR
jgi:proteic killer suppression protein